MAHFILVALLACAFVVGLVSARHNCGAPMGASFSGLTHPFYTANGVASVYTINPNGTSTLKTSTVIYGNDPTNSRYAIDLGTGAKQYVTATTTYETIVTPNGVLCLSVPTWNYTFEAQQKGQMIKVKSSDGKDCYVGDVLDAPALPWRITVETDWNWERNTPDAIIYSSNTGGHPIFGGGCVTPGTVGTAILDFGASSFVSSAPESFYTLPASCAAPLPYSAFVCYTATQKKK